MTTKIETVATADFPGSAGWSPGRPDPAAASAALALAIALLRALKDRGVLAADELEDVLAEAGGASSTTRLRCGS